MSLLEIKIFIFMLCFSVKLHVSSGKDSPKNITAVNVTNKCSTSLNLTWIEPATQWTINNYIIYYQHDAKISYVSTADNGTFYVLSNLVPQANYNISISTNVSYENGTYREWPRSMYLTIVTGNTSNCKLPISNGGSNSREDDTMYVVKLVGIIIGSSVGVILVSFVTFRSCAVCAERKYDKNDMRRRESTLKKLGRLSNADTVIPIAADNFYDHVSAMKFSDNRGFKNEFTKLDVSRTIGSSYGRRPYNNMKNRFANVPTYDKTRVTLKEDPMQLGSDYINANYVEGMDGPKSYIATQAPLPETINDFWRMIWEKEIYAIVMIVHLHERGSSACAKYWPDESSGTEYGNTIVKSLDTSYFPDYIIRTFELKCKGSFEVRVVRQFQYISWPVSRNVPIHPMSFLEFTQKVSTFRVNNRQPLVVHCSSGCGRTGVFIVLDNQLERIEQQGDINVFFNVNTARDQRFQCVKTLDEYIFIHDCILEYVTFKNRVDLNMRNLLDYIVKYKETDSTGNCGFQTEFKELTRGMTELNNTSEIGALQLNARKNRFEKILPYDHTRVTLRKDDIGTDQQDGSDYINASYISNTKRKRGLIVTQNPMEATIFDFWCMIWENNSLAIVMLSFFEQEDIVPYWPADSQLIKAGKLNIRLVSTENYKHFNIRHLEVSHNEVEESRSIRQYQYKTWPESSNEDSLTAFVEFIQQCKQWNRVSKSKMLTVHCRAGTGKSGVFAAISNLIDSACENGTVNVFNTVRKLREQRTAMVQSQEQYELIYFALDHYYKTRYPKRNDRDAETQTEENSQAEESTSPSMSTVSYEVISNDQ